MKKTILPLFLFIFFSIYCNAQGSTLGTRFWVSFLDNAIEQHHNLSLVISAKKATSGTITNPNTGWSANFTLGNNDIVQINVPGTEACPQVPGEVGKYGILVTSDDPISVYASNFQSRSYDVTSVLPESALSDQYIIQTYPSSTGYGAQFLVVATEDNTIVSITTTHNVVGQNILQSFFIVLNKGETYLAQTTPSPGTQDLSNSLVRARDCKKIAVFNGNRGEWVPAEVPYVDHLYEQALPVSTWGKKFAITRTLNTPSDIIRITPSVDNTDIFIDGKYLATILKEETYELDLAKYKTSCYIETSQPCAVYLYLVAKEYDGPDGAGDPSMVWISPVEQRINNITFGAFDTVETKDHHINIVANTSDIPSVKLDGLSISSAFQRFTAKPDLSFARIDIKEGTHTLTSDNGVIAYVYGMGDHESYAYSVGSNVIDLNSQIMLNTMPYSELPADYTFCKNEEIVFESLLEYEAKSVEWIFDGTVKKYGESVTHSFNSIGVFDVEMVVEKIFSECQESLFDTVTISVSTNTFKKIEISEYLCSGHSFRLNGKEYTETGTYTDIIYSLGCDSIYTINLFFDTIKTSLTDGICQYKPYLKNGFSLPAHAQTGVYSYKQNFPTTEGCDSIVYLTLSVEPPVGTTYLKDTICINNIYDKNGFSLPDQKVSGTFTHQLDLMSVYNCDSTVILDLFVPSLSDTLVRDTIFIDEPYNRNGFALPVQTTGGLTKSSLTVPDRYGCDSTVNLELWVHPPLVVELKEYPQVCSGDAGFMIEYEVLSGDLVAYSINFDSDDIEDIDKAVPYAGRYFEVILPDTPLYPDIYSGELVFFDRIYGSSKQQFSFEVNYPASVIAQKWNDVLALLNSDYNGGGYEYTDYQWYKNDEILPGENRSYIYIHEKLDFNASYKVELTRKSDGLKLFTCPFEPVERDIDITVYPTIAIKNQKIAIDTPVDAECTIWSAVGVKLQSLTVKAGKSEISVPGVSGTYFLNISGTTVEKQYTIVVK